MNPFFFLLLLKSCSVAPLIFSLYKDLLPLLHCQKARALRARSIQRFFWTKKQLLPGRCCVFRVAGAAFGSEMGPLVWRFKTCSVITCCRQVVLLDAFAPWFSWHQRLTCRQAAAFPGSDLGASELVVSSRVPKCLHRMAVLAPKTGVKKQGVKPGRFHWPLVCRACTGPLNCYWRATNTSHAPVSINRHVRIQHP